MAFAASGLSRFGIGNGGLTFWHYKTNDTFATVIADDYFLSHYAELSVGDLILLSADLDGTPVCGMIMVEASAAGGVDTTPLTTMATTVVNTPAGNIAATTVQAAIDELDAEKT